MDTLATWLGTDTTGAYLFLALVYSNVWLLRLWDAYRADRADPVYIPGRARN